MERHDVTDRKTSKLRAKYRHGLPIALLLALPLLASGLILAGIVANNPALFVAFLTGSMGKRLLLAAPGWFDPTIGLITQPLGMLSAADWLHGIVPWWNPYSGVGMPLAAEMQTMSFFLPFVLLLKSWQGWLVLKLILQMLCGLFMYALLIELGLTRLAAFLAGALYALNATFFLVPHTMGPLPFAPLLLLGIERAQRAAREKWPLGWGLIPLALAYSIYGGYPESAYIDGILAAVWVMWRFAMIGDARWRFAGKIALGVGIGLALSLPLLVPFFQYIVQSYLSRHAKLFSWIWLESPGAPVQLFPFIYGPIGAAPPAGVPAALVNLIQAYWVQLGGWFGPIAVTLALAALLRPSPQRGLAFVMFGFVLVWQARIWGFPPAIWLIDALPLMAQTDAIRFCGPAMEIACFIMAGIAVDAWQRSGALDRCATILLAALGVAVILIAVLPASGALRAWFAGAAAPRSFALAASGSELGLAVAAGLLLTIRPSRIALLALAFILGADALGTAAIGQLGAPFRGKLDLGGVRYLQHHLGGARFYSLQPFGPNYPAAYGLASIDENELPVQATWNRYIHQHLDPYADVVLFIGLQTRTLGCVLLPHSAAALRSGIFIRPQPGTIPPDQATELRRHLAAYETIGVKYVLAPPNQNPFTAVQALPEDSASRIPFALGPDAVLDGAIPAGLLRIDRINRVDVLIGTYHGASSGHLSLKICEGTECAIGMADLATASDNQFLEIPLVHPLVVPAGASVTYQLAHAAGGAVAIWLGTLRQDAPSSLTPAGAPALHAPILRFVSHPAGILPRLVFQDRVMRIYRLPWNRPLFSAEPVCHIASLNWNTVDATCIAPAVLTWLEADYPGWHARIDGQATPIAAAETMFQSVALPAGTSRVRFFYRPPFIRISCAVALAGMVIWLTLLMIGAK